MTVQILGLLDLSADPTGAGGTIDVDLDAAVATAGRLLDDGADLVEVVAIGPDLGSAAVEVVRAIAPRSTVAVATDRPDVARSAVAAGATVLDDVDGTAGALAAELGVGCILVHRSGPGSDDWPMAAAAVGADLARRAREARDRGATEVWIDPGPGGSGPAPGVLARLDDLVATGWPVAVSALRSEVVPPAAGQRHGGDPTEASPTTAVATAAYAVVRGAHLIRTDDVAAIGQAVVVASGRT